MEPSRLVTRIAWEPIIHAAVLAPSPDNNQPWRFVVQDGKLQVFADPERQLPSDVKSMFCCLALGAAIENACLAARDQGLQPIVDVLEPEAEGVSFDRPTATIRFDSGGTRHPLVDQIAKRCTNRKRYSREPLETELLRRLSEAAGEFPTVRIDWVTERKQIGQFAWLCGRTDRMRFEYEPFHQELFKQLRFTPEEAERTGDGLDLRTLELPPGAGLVMRILRSWKLVKALNRVGLSRLLALPGVRVTSASGAIGLVSVRSAKVGEFLNAGRAFERLWLKATELGLSLHPLGSLPIFVAAEHQEFCANVPGERESAVSESAPTESRLADQLSRITGQELGYPCIAFRIGTTVRPKVSSRRRTIGSANASRS